MRPAPLTSHRNHHAPILGGKFHNFDLFSVIAANEQNEPQYQNISHRMTPESCVLGGSKMEVRFSSGVIHFFSEIAQVEME